MTHYAHHGRTTGKVRVISSKKKPTPRMHHIDGLRGVAIALVVLFHIFVGRVSSGVDVFLFLGGFFLFSTQIKNVMNPQGLTTTQSMMRIIRRLSPSLLTVSAIASVYLVVTTNSIQWSSVLLDISSSVTYWTNWRLIDTESDYASAGKDVSLFQHLWSMSVQFQIYMAVIIVIAILWAVYKKFFAYRWEFKNFAIVILVLCTIASFMYATYMYLWGEQAVNYYSTFSRFWEIGIGGIVGIYLQFLTIKKVYLRWILSTLGLFLIITTGFWINGVQSFPGPLTLVPLMGAFMVVVSGNGTHRGDHIKNSGLVIWILNTKVCGYLGKIAYNLYLTHWIILIGIMSVLDKDILNVWESACVISISVVLSLVLYYGVEKQLIQKDKPSRGRLLSFGYLRNSFLASPTMWHPVAVAVLSTILIILSTSPVLFHGVIVHGKNSLEKVVAASGGLELAYPGAESAYRNIVTQEKPVYPTLLDLDSMMPQTQPDGCFSTFRNTEIVLINKHGLPCAYGDTDSQHTLYVVGGSHSEHYLPALNVIGQRNSIKIIPIIKMGCALYQPQKWNEDDYPECTEWSDKVVQYIKDNPPTEGIVMSGTRPTTMWGAPPEIVPDYYREVFQKISSFGVPIYSIRDNPWATNDKGAFDPRYCVYGQGRDSEECVISYNYLTQPDPTIEAYRDMPQIKLIDLSKAYMDKDGKLVPVIGNVLVYRDPHHITKQFALTLTNELEKQMKENPWTSPTKLDDVESKVLGARSVTPAQGVDVVIPGPQYSMTEVSKNP